MAGGASCPRAPRRWYTFTSTAGAYATRRCLTLPLNPPADLSRARVIRWPEQPSVKAVRRAMRAFFDGRREERRLRELHGAQKRRMVVEGMYGALLFMFPRHFPHLPRAMPRPLPPLAFFPDSPGHHVKLSPSFTQEGMHQRRPTPLPAPPLSSRRLGLTGAA